MIILTNDNKKTDHPPIDGLFLSRYYVLPKNKNTNKSGNHDITIII